MRKDVALVNINGELFKGEEAKISIFDRGMLYGDSVYDVTLTFGETIFMGEEHIHRLWQSAKGLFITPHFSKDFLMNEVKRTLREAKLEASYVRIILTRGEGELGLRPEEGLKVTYIIILQRHDHFPREYYEKGIDLAYATVIRNDSRAMDPSIKSGNYLNNLMALMSVKEKKAYEAIMLSKEGHITECTTSNIWMVKDGSLYTPSQSVGILSGITRSKIIELAQDLGIKVFEEELRTIDLENGDECFITSTGRGIFPVAQLEGRPYGESSTPGKVTKKLMNSYQDFVTKYLKDYGHQGKFPNFRPLA